jgi:formyl-CoA transferase
MSNRKGQPVLEGVRVLDLTHFEAGPTCTLILAFLGAEVIKVENPAKDKSDRQLFYGEEDAKEDLYFVLMNLNKKSITLDIAAEEGRSLLLDLVERCDVLVEDFRPAMMRKWALKDEILRKCNPRLIYASVSGYGSYGPYAGYPGLDMTAQAVGGIMSITGEGDDPPIRCGATIADSSGGANLALGIVAALYRREKTGKGMRVEVSLQDCAVNLGRSLLGTHIAYGSKAHKVGNRLKDVVPWNIYHTCDKGYVAVCVIQQRQFERLLQIIGQAELLRAHGLYSLQARKKNRQLIEEVVGAWVLRRTKREAMAVLCQNDIPCGAVLDSIELSDDAHLCEREMIVEIEHHQWGKIKVLGCPVKIFDSPVEIKTSPKIGEHNSEVFSRLLGLRDADIQGLKARSII